MNVLELFSGTGSVGKVCNSLGWNVVSVDLILPATHEVDILDFNYKQYPKDYFSIIWSSPPCIAYSALKNCLIGQKLKDGIFTKEKMKNDMIYSDKLVARTLEIIDYFNTDLWFMENPSSGRLKKRDIVKGLPFYDVDYCKYCTWGYKKGTRIWTNKKDFKPLKCKKDCENMVEVIDDGKRGRYKNRLINMVTDDMTLGDKKTKFIHKVECSDIGGGSTYNTKSDLKFLGKGTNRIDRYRIPPNLIYSLFCD